MVWVRDEAGETTIFHPILAQEEKLISPERILVFKINFSKDLIKKYSKFMVLGRGAEGNVKS